MIRITQNRGINSAIALAAPVRLSAPTPVMFATCSTTVGVNASPTTMKRKVIIIPDRSFLSDDIVCLTYRGLNVYINEMTLKSILARSTWRVQAT